MDIFEAIFLGIVQGLTEFFPVSSSGHLVLVQQTFGIEATMFFDVMLHVGTLFSVFAVFWRDILSLLKPPFNRLLLLLLASIPAAIAGFALAGPAEALFSDITLLPYFFLLTAALLLATEIILKRRERMNAPRQAREIDWRAAVIMGAAQAAAIIPGLSRSGSTISAGILYGADKPKAARFSFFMSVPIIVGSGILTAVKSGGTGGISAGCIIAGMVAAAVSGFFAIKLMLLVIGKNNYKWFSLYLVFAAVFAFLQAYVL